MSAPDERHTHRGLTVAGLVLALAMAAMEMTVVSTAMPTVVAELGGLQYYSWVTTAYMLTSTVTVPIYGKLADLHGRKPVMLVAMALFLLGSMASGQARSMEQLIVFRAIQGIGAGGMQPMALTIVGDIFNLEERAKMQGVFGAVWGIAGLAGPLLGGLIVATLSWRWVFYVNVPFGVVSAAVLTFSLVENVEKRKHGLDIAGAALLAGAVVALLLGTDGELPWVLLPASAVLTALFIVVEARAKEPILPLGALRAAHPRDVERPLGAERRRDGRPRHVRPALRAGRARLDAHRGRHDDRGDGGDVAHRERDLGPSDREGRLSCPRADRLLPRSPWRRS